MRACVNVHTLFFLLIYENPDPEHTETPIFSIEYYTSVLVASTSMS